MRDRSPAYMAMLEELQRVEAERAKLHPVILAARDRKLARSAMREAPLFDARWSRSVRPSTEGGPEGSVEA